MGPVNKQECSDARLVRFGLVIFIQMEQNNMNKMHRAVV